MTDRTELFFEREPHDGDARASGGRRVLVGSVVVVAIVVGVAWRLLSGAAAEPGAQRLRAQPIVLETPEVDGWELLEPVSGEMGTGFPPPMVRRADRVCIGFGRVDFGPGDVRPSLARCERSAARSPAANEFRSLVSVEGGFDTWHFLEFADVVRDIMVGLADGQTLSDDRIHTAGSTVALRLENGVGVESFRWSTTETFRCRPEPTAWRTSVFCTDPARAR